MEKTLNHLEFMLSIITAALIVALGTCLHYLRKQLQQRERYKEALLRMIEEKYHHESKDGV